MATLAEPIRGRLERLPLASVRPWHLVAALVVVQWAAVLAFAFTVRHNGWLYYQGGDQIYHYTSAWLLGDGKLPSTLVSYQWPVALVPVAALLGPAFLSGLPAIVLFNTLVLLPVALLCTYGIGTRIAGHWFGLLAASLWVVMPWLGARYALDGYHEKYTEQFLPQALGLTAMPDFPGTVALLVSAYFTVRALESRVWADGALAGLAAGVAVGLKASNLLFVPFPLLALLLARRWRQAVPLALGLAPALIVLTVWKSRGLGYVPAFSEPAARVALGAGAVAALGPVDRYVDLDWAHLYNNMLGIREHFWSVRLVQWAPLAGLIALARRSPPLLVLIGGWFCAFFFAKGSYIYANVEDGSFFRFMMPAYPAFLLLCAAIVLLVPRVVPRLRPPPLRELPPRLALGSVAGAVVLFGLVPLLVVAAAKPLKAPHPEAVSYIQNLTPVSGSIRLEVESTPAGNRLRWHPRSEPADVFYRVFRGPASGDVACSPSEGADVCDLQAVALATTRATTYVDRTSERWAYRIGVSANWLNDVSLGDVALLSPAVAAANA